MPMPITSSNPLLAIRDSVARNAERYEACGISPGSTGFEVARSNAPQAITSNKLAIASEPMKSEMLDWLVGELQPPT